MEVVLPCLGVITPNRVRPGMRFASDGSVLPCLGVITPDRVCPGIRNPPNTSPTRCGPVGFDKSRMPWHAECARNTSARTLDWLLHAATRHTSRNTPVRHGHPIIMNSNDLRQRKTLRAIFMSSPTGFMQLVLRCDVADAATVQSACRDIRQRNSGIWPFAVISGFFATCLALASTHTHNGLLC